MSLPRRFPIPRHPDREVQALLGDRDHVANSARSQVDADKTALLNETGGETMTLGVGASQAYYHRLGRQPRGWRLIDITATGPVVGWIRRTYWDKDVLRIENNTGVTVTLKLEVF